MNNSIFDGIVILIRSCRKYVLHAPLRHILILLNLIFRAFILHAIYEYAIQF